ncbi:MULTISPECIES: hypothetical protein [Bacillaceae]|uniref:hypothetical protein n=1 Tax=Bacillaceae TaxID=186817 RepID=UPI0002A505A7|nr:MULTISPECIES: hypothetical protein [Bacillaceae]ELK44576.1 hypothetical protein D479_18479 [Halobacillus sp. BAB-2008]
MNLSEWLDPSILDGAIRMLDPDLLGIFGLEPHHVQFTLVFLLMAAVMWVMKPVMEWIILHNWKTFASYLGSSLTVLVFLQLIDRYAMSGNTSMLPDFFWSISLLGMSSFGLCYILFQAGKRSWKKLSRRHKKAA